MALRAFAYSPPHPIIIHPVSPVPNEYLSIHAAVIRQQLILEYGMVAVWSIRSTMTKKPSPSGQEQVTRLFRRINSAASRKLLISGIHPV